MLAYHIGKRRKTKMKSIFPKFNTLVIKRKKAIKEISSMTAFLYVLVNFYSSINFILKIHHDF